MSEKEAMAIVQKALDLGVNFFDTAPNYGNGTSELRLGKVLKNVEREKLSLIPNLDIRILVRQIIKRVLFENR